jgi:hypothetical protein
MLLTRTEKKIIRLPSIRHTLSPSVLLWRQVQNFSWVRPYGELSARGRLLGLLDTHVSCPGTSTAMQSQKTDVGLGHSLSN